MKFLLISFFCFSSFVAYSVGSKALEIQQNRINQIEQALKAF